MVKARKSTALSKVTTLENALKQSNVIDCKMLFDAIRQHKDEYWKSAMILNLSIPFANKIKIADNVIVSEKVYDWFLEKLYEYYGDE